VTGSAMASFANIVNSNVIMVDVGIGMVFIIGSVLNAVSLILILIFKEKGIEK
jgi:hypothetical protein